MVAEVVLPLVTTFCHDHCPIVQKESKGLIATIPVCIAFSLYHFFGRHLLHIGKLGVLSPKLGDHQSTVVGGFGGLFTHQSLDVAQEGV